MINAKELTELFNPSPYNKSSTNLNLRQLTDITTSFIVNGIELLLYHQLFSLFPISHFSVKGVLLK